MSLSPRGILSLAALVSASAAFGQPEASAPQAPVAAPYLYPYPLGPAASGLQPRHLPVPVTVFEAALLTPGEILIQREGDAFELDGMRSGEILRLRPVEIRVTRTGARFFAVRFEFPGGRVGFMDRDEIDGIVRDLQKLPRIDTTSASTELGTALVRLRTRGGIAFTLGARHEGVPAFLIAIPPQAGETPAVPFPEPALDRLTRLLERVDHTLKRSGA